MEFVHRFHKYFGFIVSSLQFSLQVLIYNLDKIHTGKIHTSEKATKFEKKSPIIFDITGNVKKWEIFSNFVAFSEHLNFTIITKPNRNQKKWIVFICFNQLFE